MTSQEEQRALNKKDLAERLEVVDKKQQIKETVTVPKDEYDKQKQENEDLKKMANGLATYLINLTPVMEETGKKTVAAGNTLFMLSDAIRAIARQQVQQPQQQIEQG